MSRAYMQAHATAFVAREQFNSKLERLAAQGRKPEESETAPTLYQYAVSTARAREYVMLGEWADECAERLLGKGGGK